MSSVPLIAVCVATYRRDATLRRLLESLAQIELPAGWRTELRVVDNDRAGSARTSVEAQTLPTAWERPTRYSIEPVQCIARARNRALDAGPADLIAFVDDDEVVPERWLVELLACLERTGADAVFGPVEGRLADDAPRWMRRSAIFDKETGPEDATLDWTGTRTSNTLVRGEWFAERGLRFDAAYGRSGGSDSDLFRRMSDLGARFASAPRARVREDVEPARARVRWLLRRFYRNGLTFHRIARGSAEGRAPAVQFLVRCAKAVGHIAAGLPALLIGRPERALRGPFLGALALGGLVAWLRPARVEGFVEYDERPPTPAPRALLAPDPPAPAALDRSTREVPDGNVRA